MSRGSVQKLFRTLFRSPFEACSAFSSALFRREQYVLCCQEDTRIRLFRFLFRKGKHGTEGTVCAYKAHSSVPRVPSVSPISK